jgi:hypothetical protein
MYLAEQQKPHNANNLEIIRDQAEEESSKAISEERKVIAENSLSNSSNSIPIDEPSCGCVPRILIVEDNEFNMMTVVSVIFDKYKFKPAEAQNGLIAVNMVKEALQKPCKCKNRAFKLIFMDI